jgi:hypothetical protein
VAQTETEFDDHVRNTMKPESQESKAKSRPKSAQLLEYSTAARAQEVDRRLLAYALAGAGMISSASPASAEIVYTSAHHVLTQGSVEIDLNHDGVADFAIQNRESGGSSFYSGTLAVGGFSTPPGAAVLAKNHRGVVNALALSAGSSIGPYSPQSFFTAYRQRVTMAFIGCVSHCRQFGLWTNTSKKFLGLRFLINGEVHYGWARFSVSTQYWPIRAKLTGYAYETEPDKAILAGDRGFGAEASTGTPHPDDASLKTDRTRQPSSLGLLSLGSLGLDAWRQPKQDLETESTIEEQH